jgi:hypothetical protein
MIVKKIAFLFIIAARNEHEWMKTFFKIGSIKPPPPPPDIILLERGSIAP